MDQMLEFSDEDFKATIIKVFQQSLRNSLATDEKKKSQQRNKCYKRESSRNYRIEKYSNRIFKKPLAVQAQ